MLIIEIMAHKMILNGKYLFKIAYSFTLLTIDLKYLPPVSNILVRCFYFIGDETKWNCKRKS